LYITKKEFEIFFFDFEIIFWSLTFIQGNL
jgi:hypothetical protein